MKKIFVALLKVCTVVLLCKRWRNRDDIWYNYMWFDGIMYMCVFKLQIHIFVMENGARWYSHGSTEELKSETFSTFHMNNKKDVYSFHGGTQHVFTWIHLVHQKSPQSYLKWWQLSEKLTVVTLRYPFKTNKVMWGFNVM